VAGMFRKVGAKHLPLCGAQFQFRYDNRSNHLRNSDKRMPDPDPIKLNRIRV
jgi:hypothetical protein